MEKESLELAESVAKEAAKEIKEERSFAMDLLKEFKTTNTRMFWIIIILIVVLVASNFYWLHTFTQYDFISQDGEGYNNINMGDMGSVYNGTKGENPEGQVEGNSN